jgi:predicted nucleic acid-binding protein
VNVLVDTSVWSLALHRKPLDLSVAERATVAEFEELIAEGRVRIIGAIRQELLSGIKLLQQFERLRTFLSAYLDEPAAASDYVAAARASNGCRGKGIVVSPIDALICAMATNRGWSIYSTDPDFANYAKLLQFKLYSTRR